MVKESVVNGKKLFACEECGFNYSDKSWAKKCEEWCKKNKSCNTEITKHSIKKK